MNNEEINDNSAVDEMNSIPEYGGTEVVSSDDGEERNQKFALENSVLLVLGANKKKISLLLLEKIFFVLKLKDLTGYAEYEFHPHVMGEYCNDLEDAVINPESLKGSWKYTPPEADDHYSGGYIVLTKSGRELYKENIHELGSDEDFKGYLRNIRNVRRAYNEYTDAEMLLLSFNAFPEYAENSDLYDMIYDKREVIAKKLLKKGRIDNKRYNELAVDGWHRWQD